MSSVTPFDPFTQTVTLLLADSTPFNVSMPALDEFMLYSVQICINYAAQLGASLILLIVLLLLTKPGKRSSSIFIINSLSLVINVIRNVLFCLYFTGPFSEIYAYFGQDYSRVSKSNFAQSITATMLSFLLLVCVEISLILQVRVVCVTIKEIYKLAIFVASNIIALMAIGTHFAFSVEVSRATISLNPPASLAKLESATNITTTISICWFCAVFVTKLGFALNERRKLGLDRFGPMQVIFIMGCQTLVIPAIFSILQYVIHVPEFSSNTLTIVAIFLPLSSLWASATAPGSRSRTTISSSSNPTFRRNKFFWSFSSSRSSTGPLVNDKILDVPPSPSSTAPRTSQSTVRSPNSSSRDQADLYQDLEAQDVTTKLASEKI